MLTSDPAAAPSQPLPVVFNMTFSAGSTSGEGGLLGCFVSSAIVLFWFRRRARGGRQPRDSIETVARKRNIMGVFQQNRAEHRADRFRAWGRSFCALDPRAQVADYFKGLTASKLREFRRIGSRRPSPSRLGNEFISLSRQLSRSATRSFKREIGLALALGHGALALGEDLQVALKQTCSGRRGSATPGRRGSARPKAGTPNVAPSTDSAAASPRQQAAQASPRASPRQRVQFRGKEPAEDVPPASWFAVWRPTNKDALRMMIKGRATGKGLNIKGKSAKTGELSGFVPLVQIHLAEHKKLLSTTPRNARIRIYFQTAEARKQA